MQISIYINIIRCQRKKKKKRKEKKKKRKRAITNIDVANRAVTRRRAVEPERSDGEARGAFHTGNRKEK